jgi:hypothetical protein
MRAMGASGIGPALAGALLLFAAPALAQEAPAPSSPPPSAPMLDTPQAPDPKLEAPFSLNDITTYGTLGLGTAAEPATAPGDVGIFKGQNGITVGPRFGIEGETATTQPGDIMTGKHLSLTSRYKAYLVGYWPFAKHFDLFAKLGLSHSRYKYEDGAQTFGADSSVNWGVGAQYRFTEHDGLRTEVLKETYHDSRGQKSSLLFSWVHLF